jgi:hypothetical protein
MLRSAAMKAAVDYPPGSPDVFRNEDVPDPTRAPDGGADRADPPSDPTAARARVESGHAFGRVLLSP